MALAGFDPEFADVPDYILRITERIWEGRDVASIRRFYAPNCLVHTGMGSVRGVDAVVTGTMEKLHQFPDRLILGEDVIWSGTPERGLLSSHRSMMLQTHRGLGPLGTPTGRRLAFRAVADCAVQENRIYEEWLVVDQSAAARQAGLDPCDLGRRWAEADAAAGHPAPALVFDEARLGPDARELGDDPAAQLVREAHGTIWRDRDLSILRHRYARAVNLHLPGGQDAYGWDAYDAFLVGYLASFPDAVFAIDHSVARRDPGRPVRVATRWRLTGTHAGTGTFGAPSGTPVMVLGITHSELVDGRVTREWVLVDETAIWRRIGRHLG